MRAFEDDDIVHVNGKVDPADDIDTINTSLTNDMVQVFASAVTVIGALIHDAFHFADACAGVCFHCAAFDVHDEEDHGLYAAAVPQALCKAGRAERLCGGNDQRAEDAARV